MNLAPSPDSDQSINDDSTNLSLIVPEAAFALPGNGHWGAASHVPYSTVLKPPHSPDADVSSNSSTEDSGDTMDQSSKPLWGDNSCMVNNPADNTKMPMSSLLGPPAHAPRALPAPLTEELLEQILAEVPMGAQLAIRICVDCWQRHRIPPGDLISFLKSMTEHSPILAALFEQMPNAEAGAGNTEMEGFSSSSLAWSQNLLATGALQQSGTGSGESGTQSRESGEQEAGQKRRREGSGDETDSIEGQSRGSNSNTAPYDSLLRFGGGPGAQPGEHPSEMMDAENGEQMGAGVGRELALAQQSLRPLQRVHRVLTAVRQWLPCAAARIRFLSLISRYSSCLDSPEVLSSQLGLLLSDFQHFNRLPAHHHLPPPDAAQGYPQHHPHPQMLGGPHMVYHPPHMHMHGLAPPDVNSMAGQGRGGPLPVHFHGGGRREEGGGAGQQFAAQHRPTRAHGQELRPDAPPGTDLDGPCRLCRDNPVSDRRWVPCDGCGAHVHHVCAMYNHLQASGRPFFCQAEHCERMRMLAGAPQSRSAGAQSHALLETSLASYLSFRARKACEQGESVHVRVLADQVHTSRSGEPYRAKSIFVFQAVEGGLKGADVVVCGLFLHEYAESKSVHVQCLDSNPLYSSNSQLEGERRQHLLTTVVISYIEFAKDLGYERVTVRVPPPTDDTSCLFSARSFSVRLRACVHLARWYSQLANRCHKAGLASGVRSGRTVESVDFPGAVLSSEEVAAECAFFQMLERGEGSAAVQEAAKAERFLILHIASSADMPRSIVEPPSMLPESFASSREAFVRACVEDGLRFHQLPLAQYATMMLVYRLLVLQHHRASLLCREGPGPHMGSEDTQEVQSRREEAGGGGGLAGGHQQYEEEGGGPRQGPWQHMSGQQQHQLAKLDMLAAAQMQRQQHQHQHQHQHQRRLEAQELQQAQCHPPGMGMGGPMVGGPEQRLGFAQPGLGMGPKEARWGCTTPYQGLPPHPGQQTSQGFSSYPAWVASPQQQWPGWCEGMGQAYGCEDEGGGQWGQGQSKLRWGEMSGMGSAGEMWPGGERAEAMYGWRS